MPWGFKQVVPSLLKAQFDVFEKKTRKSKIGNYLIDKVKRNELSTYSDLLRHLEHDLKIKVTKRGKDYITVLMPNKEKPVKLKGPAFTPGADLRELLKQSSNQPAKLNPDELLKINTSLNSGIKARASYNNKTYLKPISYKNKSINLKSKSLKTKIDMPKVATSNSIKNFEEVSPVPVKTTPIEPIGSINTNTSTEQKTSSNSLKSGSSGSGGGGGSGGGVSSLDSQIALVKSQMNNEKNPGKRAALHAQLMGLQVKKEIQARQQHNDELKRINKIRP